MTGRTSILCYHSVNFSPKIQLGVNPVHPDIFREQLLLLKKYYEFVPMSEILESSKVNRIVMTFDDGYLDNFTYAADILTELNIPATFFISPYFITSSSFFYTDIIFYLINKGLYSEFSSNLDLSVDSNVDLGVEIKRVSTLSNADLLQYIKLLNEYVKYKEIEDIYPAMDKENLVEISKSSLFNLGHHTFLHSRFTSNRFQEFVDDMKMGRKFFSDLDLETSFFFPFPFGSFDSYSDEVSNYLLDSHNLRTLSTIPLSVTHNFLKPTLPRISVQNWSADYLAKIINLSQKVSIFKVAPYSLLKLRFLLKNFF